MAAAGGAGAAGAEVPLSGAREIQEAEVMKAKARRQGLTLVHVRAQLEQLLETFIS